jgi:ketosteroid isomerase-like protein
MLITSSGGLFVKIAVTLFLVCCFPIGSLGQAKPSKANSTAEQELLALVKKWNDAELKGDSATIAALLAEDFSFLGGSNRTQYLDLMKPDPSLVIESATMENPNVRVYGDAAVVTNLNVFKLKKDGASLAGKFLSMTVWIKRVGRWQCVSASLQPAKD